MLYKNSGTVKKDCKHLVKTYICISGFEEVKYMISVDCTAEGFLFYLLFCYIRRKMTKFTSRNFFFLGLIEVIGNLKLISTSLVFPFQLIV